MGARDPHPGSREAVDCSLQRLNVRAPLRHRSANGLVGLQAQLELLAEGAQAQVLAAVAEDDGVDADRLVVENFVRRLGVCRERYRSECNTEQAKAWQPI